MKQLNSLKSRTLMYGFLVAMAAHAADTLNTQNTAAKKTETIPWNQIGVKAGADYHGEGLSVAATQTGARLHCVFQRMDGEATGEGLWLASTATNQPGDRFQVVATAVGPQALVSRGTVTVTAQTVRFMRTGLVEEYSVSMDGVRQDFVVAQKPAGDGELQVQLAVTGARVEPAAYGAQLVLEKSDRKIAYSRLHATDAKGKELPARIEVTGSAGSPLSIFVNDTSAVYPVRIDPTFSDANWVSLNEVPGADSGLYAAVTDASGNLYIGGDFKVVGNAIGNYIAQWNGSGWSALGSGMNGDVLALAVSGATLYAGGFFGTAGGTAANLVAQWNGSSWSALGSGMNGGVLALAVSGGTLYAGGDFTTAGTNAADFVAQWNGSGWSPFGSGMNGTVYALAVSGETLYAGGVFTTAGGTAANYIAQWNGSGWTALGSGMNAQVDALAVSTGGTLYAGGNFTTAGGGSVNYIAQWNGSGWSALGFGMDYPVYALAVSGGTLYAGGQFTTATKGTILVNYIAQWNNVTGWSALGSGMDGPVLALTVSGGTLYAGGQFTMAGGTTVNYVAQWNAGVWSALGYGMNFDVDALAISGGTLYAGGEFTTADFITVNGIAQWKGSGWSALGSGVGANGYVLALCASGGTLYAAGGFITAGSTAATNIAQWNGSSWSALGSGINGEVNALAASGGALYAGGGFITAGTNASPYIALAVLAAPAFIGDPTYSQGSLTLNLDTSTNLSSRVWMTTHLTPPVAWLPIYTNLNGGLWQFTDTNTANFNTKFYRLSTP